MININEKKTLKLILERIFMNRFLFSRKCIFILLMINVFNTSVLVKKKLLNYPYPEGIFSIENPLVKIN